MAGDEWVFEGTGAMKLDPILNLAFSMHSSPGVYAVLLGSGVSSAAGILTGWEITLDLITKLATAMDDDVGGNPEAWYHDRFGIEPDYSEIIRELGKTKAERRNLLQSYFEPTEEDLENGLKVPSTAHIAIAQLVKSGHLRLILSTNFDRLMEHALSDIGIEPNVISSPDSLKGVTPLTHSKCTILKLHGDYRDTRIRNTDKELSKYPPSINNYLDSALDEFGLIVCGWSAKWDIALRNALLRRVNRRFTTYWLGRGEPSPDAKGIIEHAKAELIKIDGANQFFEDLSTKVQIIDEQDRPHPLSIGAAVSTVKKFLSEPKYAIQLRDLLAKETEAVFKYVHSAEFPMNLQPSNESYHARIMQFESRAEKLANMGAVIGAHETKATSVLVVKTIERLLAQEELRGGTSYPALERARQLPAVRFGYAVGLAALTEHNYDTLAAVLVRPTFWDQNMKIKLPAINLLNAFHIFQEKNWVPLKNAQDYKTPQSDYFYNTTQPIIRPYQPDPHQYEIQFDIFEYILSLVFIDLVDRDNGWSPIGGFARRYNIYTRWKDSPPVSFVANVLKQGVDSPLLKTGFFSGNPERLNEVVAKHNEFLTRLGPRMF